MEYRNARSSTNTAFYTDPIIIRSIYKGLAQFGFKSGRILDPSMGTGTTLLKRVCGRVILLCHAR